MSSPIGIQTNISALNAKRHLGLTARALGNTVGRLSSGYRILSAADDAAGIAVSEGLRATIRSAQQAQRNASDAVALLRTAEGAFESITDIAIRMRELAIQGANDTLTDDERAYLDTEYQLLLDEIERIANVTEYNGIPLLNGAGGDGLGVFTFQIGVRNTADDRLEVRIPPQGAAFIGVAFTGVDTQSEAQAALDFIDLALSNLSTDRAQLGATMNRLLAGVDNLGVVVENLTAANSQIRDVDIAEESAELAGKQVLMQAGVSMLAQASQIPNLALRLLQQ